MGTRITVVSTGQVFEPLDFSQQEDVFTNNLSTSSGGIPMINLTLPPNLDFFSLVGEAVKVESSTLGNTSGVITELNVDNKSSPTCLLNTKLNPLVRLAKATPFVGTLYDLLIYYFTLGGVDSGYEIHEGFRDINVNAQGWEDVVWTKLIRLQQVYDFEIALVSDYVSVRPWRLREAEIGHIQDSAYHFTTAPISRTIEMDYFENTHVSNTLVYPINGVKDKSSQISARARELVEVELEVSTSLHSIRTPVFREEIDPSYTGPESIYTVIDKDGFIVKKQDWEKYGGKLSVEIGPDTRTLMVKMVGPDLSAREPYRVAFAPLEYLTDTEGISEWTPNMDRSFDSLYIIGSGVGFTQRTLSIPTGARDEDIVQEVGSTVSEPAVSTLEQLYKAALPVLNEASGGRITLSGTIARINQRGQSGALSNIPYGEVEDLNVGRTYAIMEDDIHAGMTYGEVEEYYGQHLLFDFDNQAFGNAAGARLFDPDTRRWFRITSATITSSGIVFSAEDDLTYSDVETWLGDVTYGYVEDELWADLTYWKLEMRGLR